MRPISSPNVRNAFVALVGVSAIALGAGSNVRAEDCLAAPNGASPAGQHWYYRIDRVKQRKCWYLHAPQRVAHQTRSTAAVANAEIDHPAPAAPMPAAAAPMPFAAPPIPIAAVPMPAADPPVVAPAPATDDTSSQPNVTVLAVKTIAVRQPGAEMETQSRRRAREASMTQASARAYSATPERKSASPIFFVLVFGLGLATFLMAIVIKCVAPRASWPLRPSGVARMERSAIRERL